MKLILATRTGLVVVEQSDGHWQTRNQSLETYTVTSVIAREGVIVAGTTEGIYRSADLGRTWSEASKSLTQRHVRWMAYHPDISNLEFAGTEPAGIFVSHDGGDSWQERPEVATLRDEHNWWLPYSPQAGCVRGFAFHGERAYAAVEVGGLLRSDDRGETFALASGSDGRPQFGQPAPGHIHPDVHSVATHPSSPDYILAPTGGGFYGSIDGGVTWDVLYDDCYVRAVWVDPANPDNMVLGPSQGPDGRDGRIEVSHDGGRSWRPVTERWQNNMVERFHQSGNTLFAVMANGQLLESKDKSRWQSILAGVSGINDVATLD